MYKMRSCPCCNTKINTFKKEKNNFDRYICDKCEHEFFIKNFNSDFAINADLYKNDNDYKDDIIKSKDYRYLIQWNHLKALNYIKKATNIQNLLDIGTFNGFFVKFMRQKGYNAYGTDFNEDAINAGILNYDLEEYLSINLNNFKINQYDCITSFEVIEHLEEPGIFLKNIHNLLIKNGYLIISCPNNKMLWRVQVDYPPHHLSRFSPKSIELILENNGFEIISHFEQMSSVDLIRNFIGSLLRDKKDLNSLKGGTHKKHIFIDPIRLFLNKFRKLTYIIAVPFDSILYFLGFRYVCQLVIAKKVSV